MKHVHTVGSELEITYYFFNHLPEQNSPLYFREFNVSTMDDSNTTKHLSERIFRFIHIDVRKEENTYWFCFHIVNRIPPTNDQFHLPTEDDQLLIETRVEVCVNLIL